MTLKWLFYLFSILFCLSIVACQSAGIICRPSSAITSSDGSGTIKITWDSNTEENLVGYRIFYGTSQGKYKNCVDVGKATESSPGVIQYNLTGLVKAKQYYIAVVAVDKYNQQSSFSVEVSGVAK
ncbi:MAG: fibronectin type III domain-containing protein [Thermodesulfobacteriota bacterium]|jgi:fibronectin type 3 domain-containing protein